MGTEENGQIKAVVRTFTIIDAIAKNPTMGISDLARETDMPKATVFRFIQTLKELGFLIPLPGDEGFLLTMKLFQMGSSALENQEMIKLAHPFMTRLSDLSRETIHLSIRDGNKIIYIHKIDSQYSLQMQSAVGRSAPLHCTGMGKVLSAWEPEERMAEILKDYDWTPYTEHTLVNAEDFFREMAQIREQGFAEDREEHEEKIFCIAVPVRDHTGSVVAGLSISQPRFRLDKTKQKNITRALLEESRLLSELL